jgi:hypothetical protein
MNGSILAHDDAMVWMRGGMDRLAGVEALRCRRDNA